MEYGDTLSERMAYELLHSVPPSVSKNGTGDVLMLGIEDCGMV